MDVPAIRAVRVPARVGLVGNPSDGYGGTVVSFTLDAMAATVRCDPSPAWTVVGRDGRRWCASAGPSSAGAGAELLAAALAVAAPHLIGRRPRRLSFSTTVPRQVGLSGSSAIVIGALRCLVPELDDLEIARLALAAEVEVLGVAAGPQDRVVQALGGLVAMDFGTDEGRWSPRAHRRLDVAKLPPLVVAWDDRPGTSSGVAHGDIRRRWEAGDPIIRSAMSRFADLGVAGAAVIDASAGAGDSSARADLAELVAEAGALREEIWDLDGVDRRLLATGRSAGAATTLAGSGGAVVCVAPDGDVAAVVAAHRAAGHRAILATVGAPSPRSAEMVS